MAALEVTTEGVFDRVRSVTGPSWPIHGAAACVIASTTT